MGGLPGCHPTHHAASATPCVTTGPSVRRCLPPLNPAVVSPDPTSLRRPLAGFGLLAQPGSASPPMGTSPNWIYRPATRSALFDLCPTAQHEKNSPSDVGASATPQEKRASPPPSLLAPWVVPRGQLRWRRGGRGGRGGGGGRERESPLRRRGAGTVTTEDPCPPKLQTYNLHQNNLDTHTKGIAYQSIHTIYHILM
jgi:hypothetical protein